MTVSWTFNRPWLVYNAPFRSRSRHSIAFLLSIFFMGIPGMGLQADGLTIDSELHLGTWSPFANHWQTQSTVCAWSLGVYDFYNVTASSLAAGSDFELTSEIGDPVAYTVSWRNNENSAVWENLLFDVLSNESYAYAQSVQCIGGPTAEVRIELDKAAIDAALPGVYSDMLLITLSPL